jgi:hypothetical protein
MSSDRTCGSDLQGSSEDPKELFQLRVRRRSSDREVTDPTGVGGLHQVVSELRLSLFAYNRQKKKEGKLVSFVISKKFDLLLKVTQ